MAIPNWLNRTLWTGDNLNIMRGMNSESVDLIYLDPPFNSNRLYAAPIGSEAAGAAFKDTWTLDDVDEAWHGEIADRDPTLYAIIDAAGYAHGKGMKSYLIMMAVRLMEMRRILKETGSIYLHCDPTASHYLKTLMDAVFGAANYRSEISWKRSSAHNDGKQGRRVHGQIRDVILFYTKGKQWTWNQTFTEYDEAYAKQFYRHIEEGTGRRYQVDNLTAAKPGGDTSYEWRVKRPFGGNWQADLECEYESPREKWEYKGIPPYRGRYWAYSRENMEAFARDGRLYHTKTGMPRYKRYLDEMPGVPIQNNWVDIPPVVGNERIGYPTQKPLALLERIIKASSDKGQVILDPFCGCATACVAAEKLERQWVGIDLSAKAGDLVKLRLRKEMGLFYDVHHRLDIPRRVDQGKLPNYRTHKHTLFGIQEGLCAGCRDPFAFRNMTVDHVVPQSKGGTDHMENLQLLCGYCNSKKGARSQEEFVAILVREGLRKQGVRT